MLGTHFRRQVPIGPYVADFACMAARLIIEVDGSQHGDDAGMQKDAKRTQWLEQEGYRVLRFWNNDVTRNIKGVLEAIHVALYGSLNSDTVAFKHETYAYLARSPHPGALRAPTLPLQGRVTEQVALVRAHRARISCAFSAARSTSAPARYILAIRRVLRMSSSGLPSSTRKSARLPAASVPRAASRR